MNKTTDKIVYDFKQALGQQAFYTFDNLSKQVSQEEARDLVVEELDRIRAQFSADALVPSSSIEDVEEDLSRIIVEANKRGDITRVMEIEDDLAAIRRVKALIEMHEQK